MGNCEPCPTSSLISYLSCHSSTHHISFHSSSSLFYQTFPLPSPPKSWYCFLTNNLSQKLSSSHHLPHKLFITSIAITLLVTHSIVYLQNHSPHTIPLYSFFSSPRHSPLSSTPHPFPDSNIHLPICLLPPHWCPLLNFLISKGYNERSVSIYAEFHRVMEAHSVLFSPNVLVILALVCSLVTSTICDWCRAQHLRFEWPFLTFDRCMWPADLPRYMKRSALALWGDSETGIWHLVLGWRVEGQAGYQNCTWRGGLT